MKVQLLADISGDRNGAPWPARGEVIDVPEDEGEQLIAAGVAQKPGKKTEIAADDAPAETAALTTEKGPTRRKTA